jgi:hypothetical protein
MDRRLGRRRSCIAMTQTRNRYAFSISASVRPALLLLHIPHTSKPEIFTPKHLLLSGFYVDECHGEDMKYWSSLTM